GRVASSTRNETSDRSPMTVTSYPPRVMACSGSTGWLMRSDGRARGRKRGDDTHAAEAEAGRSGDRGRRRHSRECVGEPRQGGGEAPGGASHRAGGAPRE